MKHGRDSHVVECEWSGAGAAPSWRDVAMHLARYCVAVDATHFRFMVKGREVKFAPRKATDSADADGIDSPVFASTSTSASGEGDVVSCMLMLTGTFYLEQEGARWLQDRSAEVEQMQHQVAKWERQLAGRLLNEENLVECFRALGDVGSLLQSVDGGVGVHASKLPEMETFKTRLTDLHTRLQDIRRRLG